MTAVIYNRSSWDPTAKKSVYTPEEVELVTFVVVPPPTYENGGGYAEVMAIIIDKDGAYGTADLHNLKRML